MSPKKRPCQTGHKCEWGRKESETRVICSMPKCVKVVSRSGHIEDRLLKK